MVLNILKRYKSKDDCKLKIDKDDKNIKFLDFEIRFDHKNKIISENEDKRMDSTRFE